MLRGGIRLSGIRIAFLDTDAYEEIQTYQEEKDQRENGRSHATGKFFHGAPGERAQNNGHFFKDVIKAEEAGSVGGIGGDEFGV